MTEAVPARGMTARQVEAALRAVPLTWDCGDPTNHTHDTPPTVPDYPAMALAVATFAASEASAARERLDEYARVICDIVIENFEHGEEYLNGRTLPLYVLKSLVEQQKAALSAARQEAETIEASRRYWRDLSAGLELERDEVRAALGAARLEANRLADMREAMLDANGAAQREYVLELERRCGAAQEALRRIESGDVSPRPTLPPTLADARAIARAALSASPPRRDPGALGASS